MFDHLRGVISAGVLLVCCLMLPDTAAHGQAIRGRVGRGQRVGRVVLPTPPYNPNAGILNGPKTRGRTTSGVAARRPAVGRVKAKDRNPRPGTIRGRRVRRVRRG
jgi:hypothetical protein